MQFLTGISRNTQSKSYMLSLTVCVWEFQNSALWDTHEHALMIHQPYLICTERPIHSSFARAGLHELLAFDNVRREHLNRQLPTNPFQSALVESSFSVPKDQIISVINDVTYQSWT